MIRDEQVPAVRLKVQVSIFIMYHYVQVLRDFIHLVFMCLFRNEMEMIISDKEM